MNIYENYSKSSKRWMYALYIVSTLLIILSALAKANYWPSAIFFITASSVAIVVTSVLEVVFYYKYNHKKQ